MVLERNREQVQKLYSMIATWKGDKWAKYVKSSKENLDFELGKQWTDEELKRNQEIGNYTITINMMEQVIEYYTGMLAAEIPVFGAIPIGSSDDAKAALAMKLLHYIQGKNDPETLYMDWIHDAISANISYLWVYNRDTEIKWRQCDVDEVIVDPNSKHRLFDDARYVWLRLPMTVEDAKATYNITESLDAFETGDKLSGAANYRPQGSGYTEDIIDTVTDFSTNRVLSADGTYVVVYVGWRRYTVRENGILSDRIEEIHLVGPEIMFRHVLPPEITHYPLIPYFPKNTKSPYKVGKGELMKEIQKFINKTHGVALKNAQNLQPKGIVESDMLPDGSIEEWNKKAMQPGAWMEANPTGKTPYFITGQAMPNGMLEMLAGAKETLAYQSATAQMMKTQDSFKSQQQLEIDKETSLDIFRSSIIGLKNAQRRLGKVTLQYAAAFMTEDEVVEITDGMSVLDRIELNKKMNLDVKDESSIKAFKQAKMQEGLLDTEVDDMIAKAKDDMDYMESVKSFVLNKVSMLKYDVAIVNDKFSQSYREMTHKVISYLVEKGLLPPEELLKLLPIDNKAELTGKVSTVQKLTSQVKSSTAQVEDLSGKLDKLMEENRKLKEDMILKESEMKIKLREGEGRVKVSQTKTQAKLQAREVIMMFKAALEAKEAGKIEEDITEEQIFSLIDEINGEENVNE